ncbi:MAG: hypothetical protein JXA71_09755, partial [Chitinispirillaceae bacterium]|nr:hypothetical protein [Chitinispirillaceae bacterium]
SNLASEVIAEKCAGEKPASDGEILEAVKPALIAHFQPALIGRCRVIPFRTLSKEALSGIVGLKLDRIARRMHDVHKLAFSCSPALVEQIVEACSSGETGARAAQTIIDQSILPGMARQLLSHLGEEGRKYTRVHIGTAEGGEFEIVFGEEGDLEKEEAVKGKEKTPEAKGAKEKKGKASK